MTDNLAITCRIYNINVEFAFAFAYLMALRTVSGIGNGKY